MTGAAEPRQPYPGLRAFTRKDTDLFFGREDCIDDLVDLHLGTRRPMMAAFLDGVGVKHDDGRIDTEESGPIAVTPERLRAAADDIAARFPLDEVVTYFLTLLLQDPETWGGALEWLESRG